MYWGQDFEKFTTGFHWASPADIFVFLDESAAEMNDGSFTTDSQLDEFSTPAAYHNGCGSLSFADGHAELHHWDGGSTPDTIDTTWLTAHATVPE